MFQFSSIYYCHIIIYKCVSLISSHQILQLEQCTVIFSHKPVKQLVIIPIIIIIIINQLIYQVNLWCKVSFLSSEIS